MRFSKLLTILSISAFCHLAAPQVTFAEDVVAEPPSIDAFIKPLKLKKTLKQISENEISAEQINILSWILTHTYEVQIHRMRGATENQVYVHKDGHKEAVFDKDGNAVKDGINDASYNFFPANKQPFMHFTFDINPWIMWGNSPTDPTKVNERIYAYMGDLEGGIKRAHAMRDKQEEVTRPLSPGQKTAIAIFHKAIQHGEAEKLFDLMQQTQPISDTDLIDILTKLDQGFQKTYLKVAKKEPKKDTDAIQATEEGTP